MGEAEWPAILHFRIHDICHNSTRLKEVIVRDLLPSSSMIKDLSLGFGIPISQEELGDAQQMENSTPPAPIENFQHRISTLPQDIQTHQDKYLQWRNNMLLKRQAYMGSLVQVGILSALRVGAPRFHWGFWSPVRIQTSYLLWFRTLAGPKHLFPVPLTLAVLLKYEKE